MIHSYKQNKVQSSLTQFHSQRNIIHVSNGADNFPCEQVCNIPRLILKFINYTLKYICSLLAVLLAVQCVYSVRLVCSKEIVCDIEDIQSIDDFFVNQYIPSDVKSVRYQNVLLDKVEGYFFHAIRRHVKNVDIIQSPVLRWISIPGQMNVSSYSVIQTSVRSIQIDARNAITVFSVSDSKLVMIPESISNLRASVNIAVERCQVDALDIGMHVVTEEIHYTCGLFWWIF